MTTVKTNETSVVLKVGGANLDRPEYLERLARHVAELRAEGRRIVLVHGGGVEIGALHDALDLPFRKVDGLRVTSEATLRITTQVLCGLVNKRIVASFVREGLPALGLSGVDCGLLRAELVDEKRLGRVGTIREVDAPRLRSLLDLGHVIVLSPVSLAADGEPCNVNADTAAHAVATALSADQLDFISDVPGVRTVAGSGEVADTLRLPEAARIMQDSEVVSGGMRPKLEAAITALNGGVGRVRVGTLGGMAKGRATEIVA